MSVQKMTIGALCPEKDNGLYEFHIPAYQRGYRWTPDQVEDLLRDIDVNFLTNKNDHYCLQPLVVRNTGSGKPEFEVIDGQQRLTTIYLIMCVLADVEYLYSLTTERTTNVIPLDNDAEPDEDGDGKVKLHKTWSQCGSDCNLFKALKDIAWAKHTDRNISQAAYLNFFKELFDAEKRNEKSDSIDRYYILSALTVIGKHYYEEDAKKNNWFVRNDTRASDVISHIKNCFYFL